MCRNCGFVASKLGQKFSKPLNIRLILNKPLNNYLLLNIPLKNIKELGGSPGLVVMGGDSCSKGSNPGAVYWMDLTFFHIDLLKKMYCLFEKTENKRKRGRVDFKTSPNWQNF